MKNETRLTSRLADALQELEQHRGRLYWWRQSSMRKLAELGYAETLAGEHTKIPAWKITQAGRDVLYAE